MPWNCLCAAKEKRKLEISAPILNIEDTHNNQLQLVPLKQQQQQQQVQSIAYKFDGKQHKKLARRHSIEKTKSKGNATVVAAGNCGSDSGLNGGIIKDQQNEQQKLICTNNNNDGPIRKISSSKWRRNKKQATQQQNNKLANNNEKVKASSKNNIGKDKLKGTPEKKSLNDGKEENEKITKQLANVKFSFDTKSKKDNEKDTDVIVVDESERNAIAENDNKNLEQQQQYQQQNEKQNQTICNGTSPRCTATSDDRNATSTATEKEQLGSYEKNAATAVTKNDNDGNNTKTDKINENVNVVDMEQLKDENTGNYDEIPLIKVEKIAEGPINSATTTIELNACQRTTENSILDNVSLPPGTLSTTIPAFPLGKSSESIPFIDDEEERKILLKDPRKYHQQQSHHHHHHNHNHIHLKSVTKMGQELPEDDHSARFITLHPKNIASLHTYSKQFEDEQTIKYLELATNPSHTKNQKNYGKSFSIIGRNDESFSSPLQQEFSTSASADTVEHNFQIWKAAKGKLCQVCHGSLIVKPNSVVKCFNCDLICHNWCASSMPTIRYHDTSFIIFRKWLKAQDELAFPSVHQYTSVPSRGTTENLESSSHQIQRNIGFDDHYLTDSECTYTNGKLFDGRNNANEAEGKFPRRRAKSLEKCKQPTNKSDNDDQINDSDDSISLIIQEPISNDQEIQIEKSKEDDQNNNALGHENIKLQIVESVNKNSIDTDTNLNVENYCSKSEVKDKNEQEQHKNYQQPQKQKEQEDEEEEEEDNTSIADETKEKFSHDVIVDVHCSNRSNSNSIHSSCEALVITEQEHESPVAKDSSNSSIPDDVPEVQRRIKPCHTAETETDTLTTEKQNLRISDSSDRTLTSDGTSNHITMTATTPKTSIIPVPLIESKFKAQSEPFQRKKYNRTGCSSPISITSSSSLSLHTDDPDEGTDYATIDLRRPGHIYPISEDQLFTKSSDDTKSEPIPKSQSFPIPSKHYQYHHQHQHHQHNQISDTLRLHYVTQRILASVLPRRDPNDPLSGASIIINRPHSEGNVVTSHEIEDKYEKEVISMLEQKHGKNYKVLDLESCISVVTLERLCELCKLIDQWLGSGQEKVIVLQDREDRQRLGATIAAYLEYLDICASNFSTRRNGLSTSEDLRAQNTIARNWLDLDIFSMKKFLEDFIGPLRIPSYRRYLQLFSGLLSGKIKMNSSPIRLEFISIESPPSWLQYDRFTSSTSSSSQTEWNSFIKIYEGLQCIYTSDIHIIPITTRRFLYQIGNLRLRGDILIRCYQIVSNESNFNKETMTRELLFSVQFHTCAINTKEVTFTKNELDFACDDPRFPKDNKITLHLSTLAANDTNYVFQSPLIRTEPPNALAKADSVETLDMNSSYHTQGPIDGSLYATILKSPKSHPSHLSLNRSQSVQESFGQQQNLISPPPQFSNKQYDTIERRSVSCNTPSIHGDSLDSAGRRRETSTTSTTSSTITATDTLRGQSQSRSDYSYVESRPGTSQSTYQDKYTVVSSTNATTNKYPSGNQQSHNSQQQQQPPITIVETYATIDGGNSQSYQNGRQSVRSPLTLSMDSGISSSGVLNRPPQGSSVSPSSFPSQASPQEDRHRELDDILSDMLMTVQDIPDLNKSYKQHTVQKIVRSQSVIPTTSGNYGLPSSPISASVSSSHHQQQFNKDTVKRSQSYTATQRSNLVPITATSVPVASVNSPYLIKDRGVSVDLYDTSSTTTTLTPPPSESGRDTPTTGGSGVGGGGYQSCTGSSSNISTLQRRQTLQRETREIHTNIVGETIVGDKQHQPRNNIIMDLQQQQHRHNHQSSVYPQTVQTKNIKVITTSEDDTSIPYHARENSQPFTYGNVPPVIPNGQVPLDQDPRMIKTQSGLSSPSLVRKTLGSSSQTLRKTPPRNDFEEMLRERREKVMNEKYSISDKPSSVDFDKSFDRSWTNSATLRQTNGYHCYNNEPLKRSNTLDGFHRSTSTDGISGQTWLQLQQQKLRAKKDQEMRENRRYFEEQIHTEIRNRPLRSRANVQRYDGYASDTAAFADEVDYRRPLHVQTPYRSPDRNYHTMTTTTTTVTQKDRPFATMRRANELAKRDAYGSPPISPISVLNTSPNGHLSHNQSNNNNNNNENSQNGLLSMADSPSRNGHIRLESDLMENFQADNNNSLACTNISSYDSRINNNNSNINVNLNAKNGTTDHIHHNVNNNNNINNNKNNNNSNNNNNNNKNSNNNNSVNVNDIHHSLSLSSSLSPPPLPQQHNQLNKNDNLPEVNNHHHYHHDLQNHRQHNDYLFHTDKIDTTTSTTNTVTSYDNATDNLAVSGQLALDRLLASLAIVTNLMDQQLTAVAADEMNNVNHHHNDNIAYTSDFRNSNKQNENFIKENDELVPISWSDQLKGSQQQQQQQHHHIQQQNNNFDRYPINSNGQLSNSNNSSSSKAKQELTNVIADLTEFTRTETLRQMNNGNCNNGYSDNMSSNSNNSNTNSNCSYSNNGGNIIKRITSESENSSSISPSLSERSNAILWPDQVREESFSSYRSETDPELSIAGSPRPETPAFPVTPRTPYGLSSNGSVSPALPPKSPTSQRRLYNSAWSLRSLKSATSSYDVSKDLYTGTHKGQHHEAINQNETVSCYTSRRNSNSSNANSEPQEVAAHHVKFVQDSSKYWYKPNLSREEAVNLLRNAVPGTFIVRDSTTFRNAFGLVVRVAHPPPGVVAKGNSDELVRHFLVEPTSRGVRLKGCANEPVFTSLSALVYQHSITPLALPCRLIIPDRDIQTNYQSPAQKQLLTQGAACNVLYLYVCDTESLTGEEAVRRAVYQLFSLKPLPTPTEVHFKVSQQGITLTDNTRQKFFRKHYSANMVSFCGLDPDKHMWSVKATEGDIPVDKKTIFAFVARRSASSTDNQCHVFCDLQPNQPATAIVSFVNKVLPTEKILNQHI